MSEINPGVSGKTLTFSAIVEIGTAAALLVDPAIVARLLLGADVGGLAVVIGRCFGIALLGLGLVCLPQGGRSSGRVGMLAYNALIALYLAYLATAASLRGPLLWPAVILHAAVALLLARPGRARSGVLAAAVALALFAPAAAFGQANETVRADIAVQITAARKANAALMQTYAWDSRTELLEDGTVKDTRVELVNYVNGQMQKSLVSDQGPSLPRFGVRKRIAESKQKEMQEYLAGLKTLLDQYTLPTSGKVLDFINQAKPSAPDAQNVVVIAGSGVVLAGDSLSIWTDMATRKTLRVQVSTAYKGDPVTFTATFATLASGLNYLSFGQIDVPAKSMTIQVSNFNFNPNG